MAKSTTIGVIGLGRMGGPLARRLLRQKLPLMVWDSVADCRKPFENRKNVCVATPAAMAHACSVVFFVVPSSKEITVCLKGADGMLVNARKGLVLCDLTTSDPVDTRRLAKQAATRGIHYLDAGMSGGPAGITDGSLALMVGGDAQTHTAGARCICQERLPSGRVGIGPRHEVDQQHGAAHDVSCHLRGRTFDRTHGYAGGRHDQGV